MQSLFQRRPESLGCHGDEWLRLEARARALQHRALEQEVWSQRRIQVCSGCGFAEGDLNSCIDKSEGREVLVEKGGGRDEKKTVLFLMRTRAKRRRGNKRRRCLLLQEWTCWEEDCSQLSAMLDDAEAFISSGEPEASDEKLAEHRLDACQVKRFGFCFSLPPCFAFFLDIVFLD